MRYYIRKTMKVDPTADTYAEAGLATLLRAHVACINTETTVIWSRYQSMLLANTLLLALTVGKEVPRSPWVGVIGIVYVSLGRC